MNLPISVHPSVIIWLSILFYLSPEVVFPFLMAAGLHEVGHALMLLRLKKPPNALSISFSGAKMKTPPLSYREERTAAAAGPAVSILLCLLFPAFPVMSLYSLILGLINLIPVPGLDGWRILRCTLLLHNTPESAEKITAIVSLCCAACLMLFSCILSINQNLGLWPVTLAAVFLIRTLRNNSLYYE